MIMITIYTVDVTKIPDLNADFNISDQRWRRLSLRFDVESVNFDLFPIQRFDERNLPVAVDGEFHGVVELTILARDDAEEDKERKKQTKELKE